MDFTRYHQNDWKCSNCQTIVYGNNNKILCICGQTKWNSKHFVKDKYTWRVGDKNCSNCKQWNFKKNSNCKFCQAELE
jgi:hypothetical protein